MKSRFRLVLLSLIIVTSVIVGGLFLDQNKTTNASDHPSTAISLGVDQSQKVVIKVYYDSQEQLNAVAGELDIWEVHQLPGIGPGSGYAIAAVYPAQQDWLETLGYRVEIDQEKTSLLNQPLVPLPGQGTDTIPGYPCYRTVEETFTSMQTIVDVYPNLADLYDIGNSWDKDTDGGPAGYDILALRLTNKNKGDPENKPTFFLMAEIHAREYVTTETAMRYAEYLVSNYGIDPDITWLLDYFRVYIVTVTNPDGRKWAEQGYSWRKNTDTIAGGGCSFPDYGIDINRNHSFKWGCCGGSSGNPCAETYRGPSAGSEPETQAIQNLVLDLFPDQRGGGDTDPAPLTTTGTFITLHSYSQLVLWPWGWTSTNSPNHTQLQTLGRHMAYFNGYTPQHSYQLYATDGTSDDWAYGELGVASYTFEMGTTFFQSCGDFESTIYPDNLQALLYAFKTARRPYMNPAGPDSLNIAATPGVAEPGEQVLLTATADDTRYNNLNGTEPTQNIVKASYSIDNPSWVAGTITYTMSATDGVFDEKIEGIQATIDTTGLSTEQHTVFVESKDAAGHWGVVGAAFLYIVEPGVSPVIEGYVSEVGTNAPLDATVTAGMFNATTDPATGYYSMTVISSTYDMVATSANLAPGYAYGVIAEDYEKVQQDFLLYPFCEIWSDDVESGNQGWAAQSPWAITTESFHSSTHSWTDSPGGNYQNNRNISLTSQVFDFSDITGISVSFWHKYAYELNYDYGYVEYSTDNINWTAVASYTGSQTNWLQKQISISGLDNQASAYIRFRLSSDDNTTADGWHIDDIVITGGGPVCIPPVAGFSSNSPVPMGQPMQFTNETIGSEPITYEWDFGDGIGSSTDINPAYTYADIGLYTVTLTATNDLGTDSVSHPVEVVPIAITSVVLTQVTQDPIYAGETVNFSANLLPDDATKPYTYTIDYDDGTVITDTSSLDPLPLSHVYTTVGLYTISIEALNEGMTDPVADSLDLTIVDPTPVAEFTSNSPVFLGQPVQFTNHTTGQEPITIAWDFGDGATSTQTDPSHTYASIGTYTVTLTVTGKGTDSVTHPVTVLPIALTSVDLSQVTPNPIYLSDTVEFSADLLPDDATMPYTYTIDYGDGISSTNMSSDDPLSLSHYYMDTGNFTVQIEAFTVGMTDPVTDSLNVSVLGPGFPYAEFTSNSPVLLGQAVEFANHSSFEEPVTFEWDFGDGMGTSNDYSPTYTYTATGTYTVTLTVTNVHGSDSVSHPVTVQSIAITSVDLTQVSTGTIFPGDTVEFSADLLPEDATKPYNYTIDYGDGTVISGTSDLDPYPFEHVFTSNGWHTVQISVWNAGMTDPVTNSLDILVAYKFLLPITVK